MLHRRLTSRSVSGDRFLGEKLDEGNGINKSLEQVGLKKSVDPWLSWAIWRWSYCPWQTSHTHKCCSKGRQGELLLSQFKHYLEIQTAQQGLLMVPELLFFDGIISSKSNSLLAKELPENIELISIQNHFEKNSILVRFEHKIQMPDDESDAVNIQLGNPS